MYVSLSLYIYVRMLHDSGEYTTELIVPSLAIYITYSFSQGRCFWMSLLNGNESNNNKNNTNNYHNYHNNNQFFLVLIMAVNYFSSHFDTHTHTHAHTHTYTKLSLLFVTTVLFSSHQLINITAFFFVYCTQFIYMLYPFVTSCRAIYCCVPS